MNIVLLNNDLRVRTRTLHRRRNRKDFLYEKWSAVAHSIVIRWLKRFRSGCKNLDNQAKSLRLKIVYSAAVFETIEASGERDILHFNVVRHLHNTSGKTICTYRMEPHATKVFKNFWLTYVLHILNFKKTKYLS